MRKTLVTAAVLLVLLAIGLLLGRRFAVRKLDALLAEAAAGSPYPVASRGTEVNLLSGTARLGELVMAQPPGFEGTLLSLQDASVKVRYAPLLRGAVRLERVAARELAFHLVRNTEGDLNIRRKKTPPVPPPAGRPAPEPEKPPAPESREPLPEVTVEALETHLTVTYTDLGVPVDGKPYEAVFRLQLQGSGLATFGDPADESAWGPLSGTGTVEAGGTRGPVELKGRLAPLANSSEPSFRLNGSIVDLGPAMIRPLLGKNVGIQGEPVRLDFELKVEKGRFVENESRLSLTLRDVKLGDRVLPTATLNFPVRGALEKPKLRVEQALIEFFAQALAAPPPDKEGAEGEGKRKKKGLDFEAVAEGLETLFRNKK